MRFLELPDDLIIAILCRLPTLDRCVHILISYVLSFSQCWVNKTSQRRSLRCRVRAAVVCQRTAAIAAQPFGPLWQEINLQYIEPRILDSDLLERDDALLTSSKAAALLRWWQRHCPGFRNVVLPPRFLEYKVTLRAAGDH